MKDQALAFNESYTGRPGGNSHSSMKTDLVSDYIALEKINCTLNYMNKNRMIS